MKMTFCGILAALVLTGCGGGGNEPTVDLFAPTEILGTLGGVGFIAALILGEYAKFGVWRSVLNGIRLTGLVCVVVGPLFYAAYGDATYAGAIMTSGALALIVVTIAFWKDLYPSK